MVRREGGDGWLEYQRLVLAELERLSGENKAQQAQIDDLRLKFWGVIGSAIAFVLVVLGGLLVQWLRQ